MSFIPENFDVQESSSSSYTKLENGETRIRILSPRAVFGYEVWSNAKPYRYKNSSSIDVTPDKNKDGTDGKARQFLAFVIWNYSTSRVECCSITQKAIMKMLDQLSKDPDFGEPTNYDIKITRTGEGMETRYTVVAVPPKPLTDEIKKAYAEVNIDLELLFAGEDVFKPKAKASDPYGADEKTKKEALEVFG